MKSLYCLIFLLFTCVAFSSAQVVGDNMGIIFRVQVSASMLPLSSGSKLFKDIPDAEGVKFPDGYIRYLSGKFESLYAAQQHQEELKKLGYKDAYVTALQGLKRLTPDQAIALIYADEK
jgi:hypothetical protein